MNPIGVLVADDEPGMRLIMREMLQRAEGFELLGEAEDGETLMRLFEQKRPQVVFLDVEMPGLTGVECAGRIQDADPGCVIIFATAHDCYMGDAFEVYAFDYLIKPFKVERVLQTLTRAKERLARLPVPQGARKAAPKGGRVMLKHRDGVTFVNDADILLIQREDRATVIYTLNDGRYTVPETLTEMEEKLPEDMFFRCHKSYIINLSHIRNITPYGRWTYVVQLNGTQRDALITHEKYDELERMFA